MKKLIGPDDEFTLYKLNYDDETSYCVAESMADALAGYDHVHVISIEIIDVCYLSPSIIKRI